MPAMPVEPWEILESSVLHETSVFTLERELCRHPRSGVVHPFYVIDVDDWVNILPITPGGEVVLLRQWRQGLKDFCIEIPGGMADAGEAPADAAARELREETGYGFARLLSLGSVTTNPAIQNNRCWLYVAAGARPEGEATPEETEDIEVFTVPLAEALRMVDDGRIDHTMVLNTFLKLRLEYGPGPGKIIDEIGRLW
jgi:8-oxo-dGTP pyrophosphatase MutT (NUDIX family)